MRRQTRIPAIRLFSTRFPGGQIIGSIAGFAFFILLLWSLASPPTLVAQDKQSVDTSKLCYAFLRDGDVWSVCQGKQEHIHISRQVLSFAISGDGLRFAAMTRRPGAEHDSSSSDSLLVQSLVAPFQKTVRPGDGEMLRASCGTILLFQLVTPRVVDAITLEPVYIPPYQILLCSADRQVVAGWTEQDEAEQRTEARTNIWAQTKLRVTWAGGQSQFLTDGLPYLDVSPNGKYIAYFSRSIKHYPRVCVASPGGVPSCVRGTGAEVSVSDPAGVLWMAEPEEGIKYWHPGMTAHKLVENNATAPQWITPEAALALHEWNSHSAADSKKGP